MKTNNKIIIILIIIILLLLGIGAIWISSLKNDVKQAHLDVRKEVLKNDSLVRVTETQYRKLVADTLKQKELDAIIKELGIKLDAKPKIVYQTKIIIKEVEKDTDSIDIKDGYVDINSFYPQKEGFFVHYTNRIKLADSTGKEHWKFNPVDISIALSQRKDGIWQSDIKVPDFMTIGDVTVQATPLEVPKIDNFGVLLGGGAGYDFRTQEVYGRVSGDLRFKKFYIGVGAGTNQTVDGNIKIEF